MCNDKSNKLLLIMMTVLPPLKFNGRGATEYQRQGSNGATVENTTFSPACGLSKECHYGIRWASGLNQQNF